MQELTDQQLEHDATNYRNNGQVEKAVATYRELMRRFEQKGELLKAAAMQHMVGVSYKVGNHTKPSLEALQDALHRYEALNSTVNVGRVLRDIGITYQYIDDYKEAKPLLEKSVTTLRHTNEKAELGISEAKLGLLYLEQGEISEAEQWIQKGLQTIRQVSQWFYEATALFHLAQLRFKQMQYSAALTAIEESEHLFLEHEGKNAQKRRMAQIYYLKAAIYLKQEKDEAAHKTRQMADEFAAELDEASRAYLRDKLV